MFWYASRRDDYAPAVIRGMERRKNKTGRARILSDDEIKIVWRAAEANGEFDAIVLISLLTAQRRAKITQMRWEDVDVAEGVWTIATAPHEKGNAGVSILPEAAVAIIKAQPRLNDFVFAGRFDGPVKGIARLKQCFDAALPSLPGWTLPDLRRTSRSLMSRGGIRTEIAERILGHTVGSVVQQIYDRHGYASEMEEALQRLAKLSKTLSQDRPQKTLSRLRGGQSNADPPKGPARAAGSHTRNRSGWMAGKPRRSRD
jgi:integrase